MGLTHTVGMYSPGKAFVVYEMRRHVWQSRVSPCAMRDTVTLREEAVGCELTFPTAPSPVTTH